MRHDLSALLQHGENDMIPKTVAGVGALVFVGVFLGIGKTTLGQAPVWTGLGNVTCAEFLLYRAKDSTKIEDRFSLWVTGYLSGRNFSEAESKGTPRALFGDDPLLISGTGHFITSFCILRPKAWVHEAAEDLFQHIPKLM